MEMSLLVFGNFPGLIYLSRLLVHRVGHVASAFAIEVTRAPLRTGHGDKLETRSVSLPASPFRGPSCVLYPSGGI